MPSPKWRFVNSMSMLTEHSLLYRDDSISAQKEIWTKFRNGHPVGKGKVTFYLDGDDREFKSERAMLAALAGEQ